MKSERTNALTNLLKSTQGFAESDPLPPHEARYLMGSLIRHVMDIDLELAALRRVAARPAPKDGRKAP